MSQNIFSVLQSLSHFGIVAVQGLIQRHSRTFALFVNVGYKPVFRVKQDLGVVLEVNLDDLVA